MLKRFRQHIAGRFDRNADRRAAGDTRVAPNVQVLFDGQGIVFLQTLSGVVYKSNHVGVEIWRGLISGNGLGALAEGIACRYGIPQELAAKDAAAFLNDLHRARILCGGEPA